MSSSDSPGLNLLELLRQVLARWRLVGATVIIGVTLSAIAAFLPRPTYKVESILAPAHDDAAGAGLASMEGGVGGLASLVGLAADTTGRQREAVLIMRSRSFAQGFISENKLLEVLYADSWDDGAQRWTGRFATVAPTVEGAASLFLADVLKVEQDAKTGTVKVSVEWYDPKVAATWVNQYVARINEQIRQREMAEAAESIQYLQREIDSTQVLETRAILFRLTGAQLQRSTLASVRRDFVFRVIDPARPPQPEEIYRPMRVLLLSFGAVIGLLSGVFLALLLPLRNRTTAGN